MIRGMSTGDHLNLVCSGHGKHEIGKRNRPLPMAMFIPIGIFEGDTMKLNRACRCDCAKYVY